MTINLWTEIIITGFVYLLAFFFLILKFLQIDSLDFIYAYKDYLSYISVGAIGLSYILGLLTLRSTSSLGRPLIELVEKTFFHKTPIAEEQKLKNQTSHVMVLQYGSERLNRELDFQYSTFVLLRQLSLAIPFCGISATWWLSGTFLSTLTIPLLGLFVAVFIITLVGYQRQRNHYITIRDSVYKESANFQEKSSK